MNWPLSALCALLLTLLAIVLWYSWPNWWNELSPTGNITYNLIPELSSLIIEVLLVAGIVVAISDRKWNGARETIREHFELDVHDIAFPISEILAIWETAGISAPYKRELNRQYKAFNSSINSNDLIEQLQFLAPAMTPDMASLAGQYMDTRNRLRRCIGYLSADDFYKLVVGIEDIEKTAQELVDEYSWEQLNSAYYASYHIRDLMDLVKVDLKRVIDADWFDSVNGMVGETPILAEALKLIELEDAAENREDA